MQLALEYARRAVRHPLSPTQMAQWVDAWMRADIAGECGRVTAPALLVTGELTLDRVVPVRSTLEYQRLLPTTRHEVLANTGHIGWVSRPRELTALVDQFLDTPGSAASTHAS
jgi:pimeloyl-ACP methyl ester carboxylesterase